MRGVITTVRGEKIEYPEHQSKIGKRNASTADLEEARRQIGETIQLERVLGVQPPLYRIVDVRLDDLKRLIIDLERVG